MLKNIFLILLLIFTGCASKHTLDTESNIVSHASLIVEDSSINSFLVVDSINDRVGAGGIMELQARFQNRSNFNKSLVYKIDWFDANNFAIKGINTKWKRVLVQSNRDFVINSIAPSNKAVAYKIRLNTPDSDDKERKDLSNYNFKN